MKEFLEKEYIWLTNGIKRLPKLISLYGRREEVIRIYAKLLDIDYSEASNRLFNLEGGNR